jgi:ribulose-5-phosphate 4-epimerase/fuculose-1-phosphate aldolase
MRVTEPAELEVERLLRRRVLPSDAPFAVVGEPTSDAQRACLEALRRALIDAGHPEHEAPGASTRVVLLAVDHEHPRPFRRRSASTFVVGVVRAPVQTVDVGRSGYPFLVRALANLCIYLVPEGSRETPYVLTPELGVYRLPEEVRLAGSDGPGQLYRQIAPLALSRLVIANTFVRDLPPALWEGTDATRELARFGSRLGSLGVLPAPFPLDGLLTASDRRHVQHLYGIGGLSYGNLSVRHHDDAFWMSASGIDKSRMQTVGRDLLLITGLEANGTNLSVRVSVPPALAAPRRASVDAIEHWMIYRRHRDVGAIVHVHAWMDGVPVTEVNYPCGTVELAAAVADLVARFPDPAQAVVGQKNHGLTITGRTLEDIFERIDGRLRTQVPMAA